MAKSAAERKAAQRDAIHQAKYVSAIHQRLLSPHGVVDKGTGAL